MQMRDLINVCEDVRDTRQTFVYHATKRSNLESIMAHGIQTRRYGVVHGGMDIHPPVPVIYLSCKRNSDNLHNNLFEDEVIVLKIAMDALDPTAFYPDDFFFQMVSDGEVLEYPREIMRALHCSMEKAEEIMDEIENANDDNMAEILKPFWKWYLGWRRGGEVSYALDIPATAIVGWQPYKK
jgi:hypothetical protein